VEYEIIIIHFIFLNQEPNNEKDEKDEKDAKVKGRDL